MHTSTFFGFATILSTFAITTMAHPQPHPHPHPHPAPGADKPGKYIFAFGDSMTTTTFPGSPKKIPLNNPSALPGKTSTGGSNWLEILAGPGLSLPPQGGIGVWNFAFDNAIIASKDKDTCHSLAGQVSSFKEASGPAEWSEKDESAFLAWMGTDDLLADAKAGEKSDVEGKVKEYYNQLGKLAELGAGRFVVLGVPPLDRTPLAKSKASLAPTLKECVSSFNDALSKHADAFKSAHPDVKLEIVDTVPVMNKILDAPGEDLWHDDVHPGVRIHQSVAGKVRGVLGTMGFY